MMIESGWCSPFSEGFSRGMVNGLQNVPKYIASFDSSKRVFDAQLAFTLLGDHEDRFQCWVLFSDLITEMVSPELSGDIEQVIPGVSLHAVIEDGYCEQLQESQKLFVIFLRAVQVWNELIYLVVDAEISTLN